MSVFEHIKKENQQEIEVQEKIIEDLKTKLKAVEEQEKKAEPEQNIDQMKEDHKQALQKQRQTH